MSPIGHCGHLHLSRSVTRNEAQFYDMLRKLRDGYIETRVKELKYVGNSVENLADKNRATSHIEETIKSESSVIILVNYAVKEVECECGSQTEQLATTHLS